METPAPPLSQPWTREGVLGTRLRWTGVLLLVIASLLPFYAYRATPKEFEWLSFRSPGTDPTAPGIRGTTLIEMVLRVRVLGEGVPNRDVLTPENRGAQLPQPVVWLHWFFWLRSLESLEVLVFAATAYWVLALAASRMHGPWARPHLVVILWAALACLVLLAYLESFAGRPSSALPSPVEDPLAVAPFALLGLLLVRPRVRWDRSDVEATVSSQAVVAVGLLLYTPLVDCVRYPLLGEHRLSSVLRAHWANHDSGYWLALVGLLLIAGPLYVSGDALRRLIHRMRPRR